ncbi:hypothetical protein VCHC52A1_1670, partial [Vibrio cholerae HC-52A1]
MDNVVELVRSLKRA